MGPNLFAHNENSAHVMPHVTARAVTSCAHHMARFGHVIGTSQTIFNKINHLTF